MAWYENIDLYVAIPTAISAAIAAYFGSYLRSSADQKAIKKSIKEITSLKESVIHGYLEERETSKIKREKIEAAFDSIQDDASILLMNNAHQMADSRQPHQVIQSKYLTLILLYFPDVIDKQISAYSQNRSQLLTFIHEISEQNLERNDQQRSFDENLQRKKENDALLSNYGVAKVGLEKALVAEMKKYIQ